jgi:hypothetical protein
MLGAAARNLGIPREGVQIGVICNWLQIGRTAYREFTGSARAGSARRSPDRLASPARQDRRMAYDEDLASRIRDLIGPDPELTEKKMFGGLAFLIRGHMAISANGQGGVLVHVDPGRSADLVARDRGQHCGDAGPGDARLAARQPGRPRQRRRPFPMGGTRRRARAVAAAKAAREGKAEEVGDRYARPSARRGPLRVIGNEHRAGHGKHQRSPATGSCGRASPASASALGQGRNRPEWPSRPAGGPAPAHRPAMVIRPPARARAARQMPASGLARPATLCSPRGGTPSDTRGARLPAGTPSPSIPLSS